MSVLGEEQIEQHLVEVPNWRREGDAAIVHERKLESFLDAVAFVDRVAVLAEEANHHPDILLHGWNKVRLTLSTHSAGALTEADFALAARIDALT
jgi:4a-hydroxytetrahydrobiopterin dehydratase